MNIADLRDLINSWVGNQVIFGYDPTTDELLLKG